MFSGSIGVTLLVSEFLLCLCWRRPLLSAFGLVLDELLKDPQIVPFTLERQFCFSILVELSPDHTFCSFIPLQLVCLKQIIQFNSLNMKMWFFYSFKNSFGLKTSERHLVAGTDF